MPDFDTQRANIERRRRIAEALMGSQAPQGQMVGRFYVAPSPFDHLAALAGQLTGAGLTRRLDRQQSELEAAERQRLSEALERLTSTGEISESGTLPPPPRSGGVNPQQSQAMEVIRSMPIEQQRALLGQQALATLFPKPKKLTQVDLGNEIGFADETGNVVRRVPKGISPDTEFRELGAMARHETASGNALLGAETTRRGQDISAQVQMRGQDVTMRGQDITAETTRRGQDLAAQRANLERQLEEQARERKQKHNELALDRAVKTVDDALSLVGWRTTGAIGAATRALPFGGAGSDAQALAKAVETIQANLGFRELERMKAESATGASGLGQLTEREFERLASTVANLDPNQDADRLKEQLDAVREHLLNLKALNEAARAMGGQQTASGDDELDALMQQYGGGVQ